MSIHAPSINHASAEPATRYAEDGAILLRQALNEADMALVEEAFEWRIANPTGAGMYMYPEEHAVYYQELGCTHDGPFERLLRDSAAADLAADLFGNGPIWYVGEQLFLKEGGASRRTPWHQDGSFMPFAGSKIAIFWIPLEDLTADAALEVIRGSHRGPLYDAMTFDPVDDTAPLYGLPDYPRLPDIEADRASHDIMRGPMKRGDVLVFHTRTLHGGAGTVPGMRRRSLTLRFIGDDAVRSFLPPQPRSRYHDARSSEGKEQALEERFSVLDLGEPLHRAPGVRQVRPWTGGV